MTCRAPLSSKTCAVLALASASSPRLLESPGFSCVSVMREPSLFSRFIEAILVALITLLFVIVVGTDLLL